MTNNITSFTFNGVLKKDKMIDFSTEKEKGNKKSRNCLCKITTNHLMGYCIVLNF